jgi:hypothetical protein
MISEWNIKSRGHHCSLTGRVFVEKEPIYSALFYREGVYERSDYVLENWREQVSLEGLLSAWQAEYKPPAPPPLETLRKDDAEGLLRVLMEKNAPEHESARYILALMLERKRVIRELKREQVEGKTILIYEQAASGDVWMITDPHLQLAAMESVQHEVAKLLAEGVQP